MFSEFKYLVCAAAVLLLAACTSGQRLGKIVSGEYALELSVADAYSMPEVSVGQNVTIDSTGSPAEGEPIIMNAVRDGETGEMVVTDVIKASMVTASFRNVAERDGYVSIGFDVRVPAEMTLSKWKLKITPRMTVLEDTLELDAVYITGEAYRNAQLRGYQRYNKFIASILTDSSDFVRVGQLEIFLKRNFPDIYAARTDSSFVSDLDAESIFGVTRQEAVRHYTNRWKLLGNERKKAKIGDMYRKYIKDPIVNEGIRLDTVLASSDGEFVYRYVHTFRSRPELKRVDVLLDASLYETGECIAVLPVPEKLTYYISSLAGLADMTERYRMTVLERKAYDNTYAYVDFAQGSAVVDTTLGENALELRRLVNCIDDVVGREEFLLDSLIITASCSPEGSYAYNAILSKSRSEAIKDYMSVFVPKTWDGKIRTAELAENWLRLERMVAGDERLSELERREFADIMNSCGELYLGNMDIVEKRLSLHPRYKYLREKVYPKLRTVRFEFYLQRKDMVRDTVMTSELDTLYMSGVRALKNLDYKKAVTVLRPYDDYNAALSCIAAGYNHSALDILERQDGTDAKVCYLKAMVYCRLNSREKAMEYFIKSVEYDPSLKHRANLDPEMYELVKRKGLYDKTNY